MYNEQLNAKNFDSWSIEETKEIPYYKSILKLDTTKFNSWRRGNNLKQSFCV